MTFCSFDNVTHIEYAKVKHCRFSTLEPVPVKEAQNRGSGSRANPGVEATRPIHRPHIKWDERQKKKKMNVHCTVASFRYIISVPARPISDGPAPCTYWLAPCPIYTAPCPN